MPNQSRATIVIQPSALPDATVGVPYSATLSATGGTGQYTFSIASGALPTGLTFSTTTRLISGTPTTAGNFAFTIKVRDSGRSSATKNYAIDVLASTAPGAPPPITLSLSVMPGGIVGTSYSQTITANGGTPPFSFATTSGALPGGLTLSSSNGIVSGTPSAAGDSSFTVTATDSQTATGSHPYSLSVVTAASTVITPPSTSPPPAIQSVSVSGTITDGSNKFQYAGPCTDAGGGHYTFSTQATQVST